MENKISDDLKKPTKKKTEDRQKERVVELRFRPDQIGQENVDKVIRYYNNGVELNTIVKTVNSSLPFNMRLSLVDVYTVLFVAKSKKEVKQRRKFLEFELPLDEFAKVYREWKKGKLEADIPFAIEGSHLGVTRVLRSLYNRRRVTERKQRLEEITDAQIVLGQGTVMLVEERQAIVIFLDLLNESTRNKLLVEAGEIADEVSEQELGKEDELEIPPGTPPRRIQPPNNQLRIEDEEEEEELTYEEEIGQIIDNLLPETKVEKTEDNPEGAVTSPQEVSSDQSLLEDPEVLGEKQVQEKLKNIFGD